MSDSLRPPELQRARPPCPSPTPRVYSNSCPSSQWCGTAISSSVIPFSSCPQSLPVSGTFPVSELFAWGGQSIRVSASASVLPMNTQDWSPLGSTGWISLQSKGLSRVFSNIFIRIKQIFGWGSPESLKGLTEPEKCQLKNQKNKKKKKTDAWKKSANSAERKSVKILYYSDEDTFCKYLHKIGKLLKKIREARLDFS